MNTGQPPRPSDQAWLKAQAILQGRLERSERIVCAVKSDLDLDRKFGDLYLILTSHRIAVTGETAPLRFESLADIESVQMEELFGGGTVTARLRGGGKSALAFCTLSVFPECAGLAARANALLRHEPEAVLPPVQASCCPQCATQLPGPGEECPLCVSKRAVFIRLLRLMRPYRSRTVLLVAATLAGVGATMGPPYITKMIVDDILGPRPGRRIGFWIACLLACNVLLLAARYLSSTLNSWLAGRLVSDLRSRLHSHLQYLQMAFYSRRHSGDIVARVLNDTAELQNFLAGGLPYFLVNSVSIVTIAVILFRMDTLLALLVFVPVPLLVLGGGLFWKRLLPLFYKQACKTSALHSTLNESIRSVRVVKAFSQERRRAGIFDRSNGDVFHVGLRVDRNFIGFSEVMFFVMSVGVTGVWYFAARRIAGGDHTLTIGDLLAFVGYIWLFYGPLQWFTAVLNWLTHALSAAERIFGVLESRREVPEAADAIALPAIRGAISFSGVTFGYEQGKDVIRDVSFNVAPGEMIGLVGRSGAGKSTLINLLCRFYDAGSGLITVDGYPIDRIRLCDLRRQMGIVLQEPVLFNCSILENIRYGRPEADFEAVVRAAKAAHAHDFIVGKEDGYDTVVGENGCRLSGGERQRISIARAILHDPPILILDEATSSVDGETEKQIQQGIAELIRGRTTIAIAHRLATLRNADHLLVLDSGAVAEEGTHEELLAKNGHYAHLVKSQSELHQRRAECVGV